MAQAKIGRPFHPLHTNHNDGVNLNGDDFLLKQRRRSRSTEVTMNVFTVSSKSNSSSSSSGYHLITMAIVAILCFIFADFSSGLLIVHGRQQNQKLQLPSHKVVSTSNKDFHTTITSTTSRNLIDEMLNATITPIEPTFLPTLSPPTPLTPSQQEELDFYSCSSCAVTDVILFPWFVELMGCVVLFLLVHFNIPVPYAACLFILGAIMGSVASLRLADNRLSSSIVQWSNIDSAVLLLIFLPPLIFKDAVEINFNMFMVAIWQLWLLSFPMVLLGTFLVAFAGMYIMPYSWDLGASATLGAILSSTDPIAVASVLKTSGASPRLVMHIQGESLLNDGSAFVFFTLFSQMFYYELGIPGVEQISVGEGFVLFFQMSLGGIAVGIAFGILLLGVIYELDRRLEKEFDILQVVAGISAAYLAYWVCDQILTMSGVVACVSLGIVVNGFGRSMINDEKSFGQFLALAEFLLNTLLFTLGGVIWGSVSFEDALSYQIRLVDWGWLMVLYLLVLAFRFLQVGTFYPILSRIGLKSSPQEAFFLAYGGLRGAVGVALGLSLIRFVFDSTDDYDARKTTTILQFMGGGVTLLTLTLNGTSAGFILTKLGLSKPKVSKEREQIVFEGAAKDFVYDQVQNLLQEARFQYVDVEVLKKHVPFITAEPFRPSLGAPDGGRLSNFNDRRSHANQIFNERSVSNGDQFMRVVDATRRTSESLQHATSKQMTRQKLLVELRQVFLELLAEAYNLQQEMGELDVKHIGDGDIHDVLIHSVDLATNAVEHDKSPIEDWKYLCLFSSFNVGRSHSITGDVSNSILLRPSLLQSFVSDDSNASEDLKRRKRSLRRIRNEILKAMAFKEGHKMAETKLRRYANRIISSSSSNDILLDVIQPTLQQVLDESQAQVFKADESMEENIDEKDKDFFMSHYCARILLHRLKNFTERKYEDGLVSKFEARKYLADFDDRIGKLVNSSFERALEESESIKRKPIEGLVEEEKEEDLSSSLAASRRSGIETNDVNRANNNELPSGTAEDDSKETHDE